MPSRRRRSRRSLGTKISYMNTSVVRSAQTSVPTSLGEQVVSLDAIDKAAILQQAISPGTIDSRLFSTSVAIPSGEGSQRVPAPLSEREYWSYVVSGDVELHKGGVHGVEGELEDITNVEATNSGIVFTPTDEAARLYLTGRLPVPKSRKIYATWTSSQAIDVKVVWWKQSPIFDVDEVAVFDGLVSLDLNSNGTHTFAVGDVVRVSETMPETDGSNVVLKVDGETIYYVNTTNITSSNVVAAAYVQDGAALTVELESSEIIGPFTQDGYVLLTGTTPIGDVVFDGVYKVASFDANANTITVLTEYDIADTAVTVDANTRARFYAVDSEIAQLNPTQLFPAGKASEDTFYYVNLQDREVWAADTYIHHLESYSVSNNVATVLASTPTYMMVGDTVSIITGDVDAASIFTESEYTVTAVSAGTRSVSFSVANADVATTLFSGVSQIKTKNQFIPETYAIYAEVEPGDADSVTLYDAKVFEVLGEATTLPSYTAVNRSSLTNNVATLSVDSTSGFTVDSRLSVSGVGDPYDGTFIVSSAGVTEVLGYEVVSNTVIVSVTNTAPFYSGGTLTLSNVHPSLDGTFANNINNTSISASVIDYSITDNVASLTISPIFYGFSTSRVYITNVAPSLNNTWFSVASANSTSQTITVNVETADDAGGSVSGSIKANALTIVHTYADTSPTTASGLASTNTINYEVISANVSPNTSLSSTALAIGYRGVEHSELTPTGLTLYNEDGSIAVRLSSQDISTISVGDTANGQATISYVGDGTFTSISTPGDLTVGGSTLLSGNVIIGGGLDVTGNFSVGAGTTGDISITGNVNASTIVGQNVYADYQYLKFDPIANAYQPIGGATFDAARYNQVETVSNAVTNTTAFAGYSGDYLDRLSRGVVYHVAWEGPTGTNYNLNSQFTTFASGSFYLENGRNYLFTVNPGNMRVVTVSNVNAVYQLVVSKSPIDLGVDQTANAIAGQKITSTTVGGYNISSMSLPITSTTNTITQGIHGGQAQAGVSIYWALQLSHASAAFTNTVINNGNFGDGNGGPSFAIYDMGQDKSVARLSGVGYNYWLTSGTGATSNTNTNTNTVTYIYTEHTATATITARNSAYFDAYGIGDGGTTDPYSNQESIYQGNPGTSSGTKRSQVAFNAINQGTLGVPSTAVACTTAGITNNYSTTNSGILDSYKVTKVELYLRNRHSYYASGLTAYWGYSADSNARNSSNVPAPYTATGQTSKAFTKGQGQYITVSNTARDAFASGAIRSILLGLTSASSNTYYSSLANYGYFDGEPKSDPPKLRVTYIYYTRTTA